MSASLNTDLKQVHKNYDLLFSNYLVMNDCTS